MDYIIVLKCPRVISAQLNIMHIQPTFTFKATPKSLIQWDAVSKYGQTVKVILEGRTHAQVMQSVKRWNDKMSPKIKMVLKVRAQTFLLFEAYPVTQVVGSIADN